MDLILKVYRLDETFFFLYQLHTLPKQGTNLFSSSRALPETRSYFEYGQLGIRNRTYLDIIALVSF